MAKAKKKTATKRASVKAAAKKSAPKKAAKKSTSKRKPNPAFMKALTPSEQLAKVVGAAGLARTEVVKKLWIYIKKHKLQDPKNMRNIIADELLKPIFGGKSVVSMFEMTKHISKHLK
jgi:chromatin remodeling complex protein RSC6